MANPHRGEVVVELAGAPRFVRFSWQAIASLQEVYGQGFAGTVSQALATHDVSTMAEILAIGLAEQHPDLSADRVMDLSPPILDVAAAITRALNLAFHGPRGLGPEDRETKANHRPARLRIWWRKLSRLPPWRTPAGRILDFDAS